MFGRSNLPDKRSPYGSVIGTRPEYPRLCFGRFCHVCRRIRQWHTPMATIKPKRGRSGRLRRKKNEVQRRLSHVGVRRDARNFSGRRDFRLCPNFPVDPIYRQIFKEEDVEEQLQSLIDRLEVIALMLAIIASAVVVYVALHLK